MFRLRQAGWRGMIGFVVLICVMLSGCGREADPAGPAAYTGEPLVLEHVSGEISDFFLAGDTLLVVTEEADDDGEPVTTRLYTCAPDGTGTREIRLDEEDREKMLLHVSMNSQKRMALLLGHYEGETVLYELVGLDADGNETCRVDIAALEGMETASYVTECLVTEEGSMLLGVEEQVVILDETGERVSGVTISAGMGGMIQTADGRILCAHNMEDGACVECLDMEGRKWGDPIRLENRIQYGDALMRDEEYEFSYRSEDGIYGYRDGTSEKKMDLLLSGIEKSAKVVTVDRDTMIGLDPEKAELIRYRKEDGSDGNRKTKITLGSINGDPALSRQILSFNQDSREYEIEYLDYSQSEDPVGKWNTDITAGRIPDIIDLSGLSAGQYVQKGLLEDLTIYFQRDTDVDEDDIIDPVREAMKVDGKLYYVSPSFLIFSIIGTEDDFGDRDGWTFQELQEYTKHHESPFAEKKKEDLLNVFAYTNIPQFIDWETGECGFEREEFKEILQYCNTGTTDGGEIDWSVLPDMIADGGVRLNVGGFAVEDIQFYEKMFGTRIAFIGFPDEEKNGSFFSFDNCLGISSGSDHKEGAWEFIKQFMTNDYQCDAVNMLHTPTRQDSYAIMAERKSSEQEYTDEWGNTIQPLEQARKYGTFYLEIEPLSEEEIASYTELVERTNKTTGYDKKVMEIIREEAEGYFAGDRELDETAALIQNRVSMYVNEQR